MPLSLTLLALALVGLQADPQAVPPAHTVADARRLARGTVAQPIRLTGVVTYADPNKPVFYIQDDTAGLMVSRPPSVGVPKPGDLVAVDGTIKPESFPPELKARSVTRLEDGWLPDPARCDLGRNESRWLDGQFVEVWALVQSVHPPTAAGQPLELQVSTAIGTGLVVVPGGDVAAARALPGAVVRVRGVVQAGFGKDGAVDQHPKLLSPALPVRADGPAAVDPVTVPRLEALRSFAPDRPLAPRRVKVQGVVVAVFGKDRDAVLVQDGTAGVLVQLHEGNPPQPGTLVEAVGLLDVRRVRLILNRADMTVIGPGAEPAPHQVTVEDLSGGAWDGRLVQLDARVEEVREENGQTVLTVMANPPGAALLDVVAPEVWPADQFPPRTKVQLTGAATGLSPNGFPARLALVVRSAADVKILDRPSPIPFWTHQRAALAAAALAGLCILATVWVGTLRHRVRRQTEQIRQQLEHEAALEARYRDLFEGAGDAVWVTDRDGQLVSLNQAGEVLLGLTRDEAIGRRIAEFIPPDEAALARASQVSRLGDPFELTVVPRSGPAAVVEVSSRVLPDGGVQTIARNVTERKRLLDRTQRVQKLEAIGRLAGGIAHDFNNLLTVINGSAEILRDRLPEGEPHRALADEVLDAGNRAANLTRQLLAFSRQRFVAPAPLDLNQVVSGTAALLRRLIGDEVTLVTELAPDAPWVLAETGLVEQVLMNLAVNARDAMPKGGTLTIRTAKTPGGLARLTVADTGVGMDEATQAKVFEPFFTTKPVGQGTGLGLATVYGVVQTLGGVIRFTSERGKGTVFEVDLPALADRDGAAAPQRPGLSEPTPVPKTLGAWGKPYTVLLVEDDDAVRGLARSILEDQGLTVWTAEDGPAALAICRDADASPLHLLLTDVMMPGMSGTDLVEEVLAERPELKVLFMSGYTADQGPLDDGPTSRWDFVHKPFTPAELSGKVREVLRRTDVMPAARD
ncbi:MAG TPA: ATP-binding protein [Gemmataceae bacterium]|nr:ATP-binding protein [Gemmataceae bacterium]